MIAYITASASSPSEKEFMGQLFLNYNRMMYAIAKGYVSDPDTCEDIIQDSLEQLMKRVSFLQGLDSCGLTGYISVAVRNTAINQLKKDGKMKERQREWNEEQEAKLVSDVRPVEGLLVLGERKSQLWKIWDRLSEEDRFLLEGKYILGYTNTELALQLGCKPDSIRMKLTRARRKAFDLIASEEGDRDDET